MERWLLSPNHACLGATKIIFLQNWTDYTLQFIYLIYKLFTMKILLEKRVITLIFALSRQ
ncbi:uncharacterized protein CANTADRAFT_26592 [Suhomyces tanzawaensis NRRL Y-17324]|uniref:Uncharacterized protein n=1 Tax=Suhomyces tanzawaensis NRRL Y-17324 TaxID=984487 RepID=A0A1E4SGJ1_9ASCO|nr:uncharacterized protein CANTADRAFT_26592 [Suhomyces tanzawaensis NRRL Y-17324]ODV78532.1 hypothetical protein CANTADRAFT_26592 [Suhomyces tanzawaensis NRRL Y-17324]